MGWRVAQSVVMLFLISAFSGPLPAQESSIKAGIVEVPEGDVFLDGNPLRLKDGVCVMRTGQTLSTKQGRVELTLASNTNLSLGENASLRMEQSNPNGAKLTLEKGSILIEVVQKLADPVRVRISNSTVEISKPGLYRLDSSPCDLRVYGGTALADNGSKQAQVKKERKIRLDGDASQSKFDPKASDALHQWSARRSFDIFFANPETDNWKWTGLMPSARNPNPVGFFVNSNYRLRFKAQMPSEYARRIRKIQAEQERDQKAVQDGIDTAKNEKDAQIEQKAEEAWQKIQKQTGMPHP